MPTSEYPAAVGGATAEVAEDDCTLSQLGLSRAKAKQRASKPRIHTGTSTRELLGATETQPESTDVPMKGIIGRKIGPFRFTPKQPHQKSGGKFGGWEVDCPYHRKNFKSGCRKWFGIAGPSLQDKQEAAAAALVWCAAARQFDRQFLHLAYQVDYKTAPPVAVSRTLPIFHEDAPEARPTPDSELFTKSATPEATPKTTASTATRKRKLGQMSAKEKAPEEKGGGQPSL